MKRRVAMALTALSLVTLGALCGCATVPPVDAEYMSTPCVGCCLAQLVWWGEWGEP